MPIIGKVEGKRVGLAAWIGCGTRGRPAQMEQPQLKAIRKVVPSLRTYGWQGGMESAGVALPAIAGLHCGGQPVGHLVDSSSKGHVVVLSGEEIRSADFERSGLSQLGLLADEHQAVTAPEGEGRFDACRSSTTGGQGRSRPDLEITVCGVSEWGTCPRSPQPPPSASTGADPGRGGALRPRRDLPHVLRQLLRADEPHRETPQEGDVRCRTWPSMD